MADIPQNEIIGTRIDRGVKRGPRKPQEGPRRSPKADLGTWVIPEDLNPHDVLQRYLTESTTSQIAAQYGLSRKALVKWLRATVPHEWKDVQLVRAHVKLEDGEDGIDDAEDSNSALSLACARERIKAAQFRLTALDKDYQPKQQLTVITELKIDSVLEGSIQALIARVSDAQRHVAPLLPQVIDIDTTSDSKDNDQHIDT